MALSRRHVKQSKRSLAIRKDLQTLSDKAQEREDELAKVLREGQAAVDYAADMQARVAFETV